MEHMPLPHGASLCDTDFIPCVADKDYIGASFVEYARRNGFRHAIGEIPGISYAVYEVNHPTSVPVLEKFIQTWAFFGFLQELLGPEFCHDDFVRAQDNKSIAQAPVLCTARLLPRLEQAFSRIRDDDNRGSSVAHVQRCFDFVRRIGGSFSRIDPRIALCIDVLYDTVNNVSDKYMLDRPTESHLRLHAITDLGYIIPSWIEDMTRNGWCPNEASFALRQLRGPTCLFYLSRLKREHTNQDHRKCTADRCTALQINPDTFKTMHVKEECSCGLVSVNGEELDRILVEGKLPLLKIGSMPTTNRLEVQLVPSDGSLPYIALSHIWADGLGNPHANALQQCQLERLSRVDSEMIAAPGESSQYMEVSNLIWLDTLCCPSQDSPSKAIAMGMMRKVYEETASVLVLDETLRKQSFREISALQALAMIFVAPWNRRLWCLQEGALPAELRFQFKDKAVALTEVFATLKSVANSNDSMLRYIALELGCQYRRLRGFFHGSDRIDDKTLTNIIRAVRERDVTVAGDEPICLATMFNLDVRAVADEVDATKRMSLWWRMMCAANLVPQQIIFLPVPRLQAIGYGWAPASLLRHKILSDLGQTPAACCEQGLLVQAPGVKVSTAALGGHDVRPLIPATDPMPLRDASTAEWYLATLNDHEHLRKTEYTDFRPPHITAESLYRIAKSGKARLVLDYKFDRSKTVIDQSFGGVLLVDALMEGEECRYVKTQSVMHLLKYNSVTSALLEKAHLIGSNLRHCDVSKKFAAEQKRFQDVHEAEKDPSYLAAASAVSETITSELLRLTQNEHLMAGLLHQSTSLDHGITFLSSQIFRSYWNNFMVIDEWYADDTQWCVD